MNRFLKRSGCNVPGYLEDLIGKDKLKQIFALIEQTTSINELIGNGLLDRQATATLLVKLLEDGVLIANDANIPTDELIEQIRVLGQENTQNKILLLTDSACDIPLDLAKERNIVVIPLSVRIDGKEYHDGVDITPQKFYELLQKSETFPTTSPPTETDFQHLFMENIADKDILGIFISKKMSETLNVANQAKRNWYNKFLKLRSDNPSMPKKFQMEFIDSRMVSMGTTLLVLEASEKIQAGWSFTEVKNHIEKLVDEVRVFLMVDNLDYLVRGGKIGRGSALFGKLFGFKPILDIFEGGINAKGRTIGGRRAQNKMIEFMEKELEGSSKTLRVGICHASAQNKAEHIQQLVENAFPKHTQVLSHFGPTVGAHTGPGAIGVAWLALPEE